MRLDTVKSKEDFFALFPPAYTLPFGQDPMALKLLKDAFIDSLKNFKDSKAFSSAQIKGAIEKINTAY
ncbi:hypothetical protein, partial [Holospora curviuscula]|uniref:hypothetical protein n=1 Tax=Holospora curviuscula TaxID=1082868 RepID=UPI00101AE69E